MGYLLTGLLAGGSLGPSAATYYLTAYLATILGAFGVMTVLSDSRRETAILDDYRGLFWRRPGIAGALTVMMLSLAGVPLTAGFLGKFYVIAAGASQSRWALLFTLVVGSTIGLFYYLRVIFAMYAPPEPSSPDIETPSPRLPVTATLALLGVTALVILLGTWPAPVWEIIRTVTRDLG
jgi:NADH-quinone oxidoreductase subunit N